MARYQDRGFTVGEFWLSQDGRSPAWHRTWYDKATRQTKRISLGTTDLSEAKKLLLEWYMANGEKPRQDIQEILLDEVILNYYHGHAVKVRAGTRIKYQLGHITAYFNGLSVAEACKPECIEKFCQKLLKDGLKASYVNNILTIIKAAVNRAYKRGEISSAPYINMLKAPPSDPKGEPLTVEELRKLYDAAPDRLKAMIVLGLGTGARPEAICDLKWEQIDWEANVIDLNPKGRAQTSKRRPQVKMSPILREWLLLQKRECEHVVSYRRKPIHRYYAVWQNAKKKAGLTGTVSPYSLRHGVARWCRLKGVPVEDISSMLGHSMGGGRSITERYMSVSPDYQARAVAAVDELLALVLRWGENQKAA